MKASHLAVDPDLILALAVKYRGEWIQMKVNTNDLQSFYPLAEKYLSPSGESSLLPQESSQDTER